MIRSKNSPFTAINHGVQVPYKGNAPSDAPKQSKAQQRDKDWWNKLTKEEQIHFLTKE